MNAAIEARAKHVNLRRWLLLGLAMLPFALGWLTGVLVRLIVLIIAAILEGYAAGRGA
jgi:hypothetical protein